MGKKKSDIYVCFQILPYKNKANKSIFQCKFCDRQYLQNATKMESHIITQCQKVPANVRASYTTKPGNGGGGGAGSGSAAAAVAAAAAAAAAAASSAGVTGLNLSLMNKHEDLDLNELIRDYSDSSASEAPEQMVVNVSVPGMYRMGKSGGHGGGGGRRGSPMNSHQRSVQPPKNSPPTFSSLGYGTTSPQNLVADFNQRSMQIRAFSQLVSGMSQLNNSSGSSNGGNGGGNNGRKRAKLDNHNNNNNNNNNSVNNNNYYTIGSTGSAHKILIKPSHGVPAAKMPNLGQRLNSSSNGSGGNSTTVSLGGGAGATIVNKVKPPLHLGGGATIITKNAGGVNAKSVGAFKEKLSRVEMAEIWRLLARAIYSSDVPPSIVENEHWVNFLHRLQPTLNLPTPTILSNELLDQEYTRISQEMEEKVEKSHFTVLECVSVPGSRVDECTLVFFLNCDDSPNPFLYKIHRLPAGEPDATSKDSLSKLIEDIILDIGLNKVVAFMSDLSPELEGTWDILRDKFPGLLTFGCVIHGLNSILDKILSLPEIGRMVDVIKKLYTKIEKSQEFKRLVEDALGRKHKSPYESVEGEEGSGSLHLQLQNHVGSKLNGNVNGSSSSSSVNGKSSGTGSGSIFCASNYATELLTKWKLVGKLITQLISEKAVYQQILQSPDGKKVVDGVSSDSPGKSDRSLSNHLSSESFWTSLVSLKSIIVPCLEWIDALRPDRDCSLSEVPEVFKELKALLQSHVRNFPVDDTTKQSVHKHFLGVQRKCVNEIHFTACLLNPSQKLRGVLTEDEEAQGMEFLTYFCDSRGYHAGSILRELADYKTMNGVFATEKLWKLGQTLAVPSWWKMVQAESALGNIAISLARVVPSCSMPEGGEGKGKGHQQMRGWAGAGEDLEPEKMEKLAFIQYNLQKPNKDKMPRAKVSVLQQQKQVQPPQLVAKPPPLQQQQQKPEVVKVKEETPPAPAKVEKLRIKIPKKEDCESPAMDLSARLSGCSQVSDEEDEEEEDDSDDEEENSSLTNHSSVTTASTAVISNRHTSSSSSSNHHSHSNSHHHNSSSSDLVVKREQHRSGSPAAAAKNVTSDKEQQRLRAQQEEDDANALSSDGEIGSTKSDSSSDSDDSSSDDQSD